MRTSTGRDCVLIDTPDVDSVFSSANAAAQLDPLGVANPADPDDPEFARWSLAMTDVPIGGVFDLDQWLEVGDPPERIILFRGRFDQDRVVETWTDMGYQETSSDGATIWKPRDDYNIDISNGGATTRLNEPNYATFVRPDVVVTRPGTLGFEYRTHAATNCPATATWTNVVGAISSSFLRTNSYGACSSSASKASIVTGFVCVNRGGFLTGSRVRAEHTTSGSPGFR